MLSKQENCGILLTLISAALWGLFPVLVASGTTTVPPLLFAAATTLFAACGALLYVLMQGNIHELKNREARKSLLLITLCSIVIPFGLLSTGASMTSGLNTSFLLLSEIIFTLIFTHFIGEKTSVLKLAGALGVMAGGCLIVYNGAIRFGVGDLLIVASTITYPLGNFYTKKALNNVSPSTILLSRLLLGGLFFWLLAGIAGQLRHSGPVLIKNWKLILFTGFILYGIGKIIWYEGLKRLDISKAVSLALTFPLFSLLFLIIIYNEKPSTFQWLGIAVIMTGVYFSAKRPSVNPDCTSYATLKNKR